MKTICPKCKAVYDIREAVVLKAAGKIIAKRRRKAGNQITSEQARELQAKSAEARRANREARQGQST